MKQFGYSGHYIAISKDGLFMQKFWLFTLILIIIVPFTVFSQANKYGVFVGIGRYPAAIGLTVINSSNNDATNVCSAFSPGCPNGNTTLLLEEKATRQKIIQAIEAYQGKVSSGDLFVFYYSGHGTQFPDRYSEELDEDASTDYKDSALVPYDSTQKSNKPWRNLILDDELYRLFAAFTQKGAKVVFISDSCYSGGQAKTLTVFNRATIEKEEALGKGKFFDWKKAIGIRSEREIASIVPKQRKFVPDQTIKERYIVVASSQADEPSFSQNPTSGRKMSLFTYFFLEKFNECQKAQKAFTFEIIQNDVSAAVNKYAKSNGERQEPKVDTSFYSGSLKISVF